VDVSVSEEVRGNEVSFGAGGVRNGSESTEEAIVVSLVFWTWPRLSSSLYSCGGAGVGVVARAAIV